ncbi:unnamed protein product [Allacma fusca]|uniref:Uncharacterized protein n=1 Tax=Allacma fusca TaxID=39272 RepID=A0A8J2P452_9HEXA|nr:unnamed protein product [Allacma fusca]
MKQSTSSGIYYVFGKNSSAYLVNTGGLSQFPFCLIGIQKLCGFKTFSQRRVQECSVPDFLSHPEIIFERVAAESIQWIFLFWYYGPKILVKYLRTHALGSVREPLESGSALNISPFGVLGHSQTSYFSGYNSSHSRLEFNFIEQREASPVYTRKSRILRRNSSDRELVEMPLESKDTEHRSLHEDATFKNTLSEHQLESLESADKVMAIISAEQTSCEVSGFRHGDLIEGNWECSEPKESTSSTFIPAVTNQNLATVELPPPTVSMNTNVEMLEESDFEEPSQIEEAMEVLQIGKPAIIHRNSEDSSNPKQPSQSSALGETVERAEPASNEELLEGEESRIIDYEEIGNNMETTEDANSVNEDRLPLDFTIAKYDEQQPLIASESITGPNNEVSSNQASAVSDQTEIQHDSRPLLVPPVPMDSELSDNSPLVSSQPDQENIYTLQRTLRSLGRKRRRLTRSKELTVLEEALLRLQGGSSKEISQFGTSPTNPDNPFYPFASEEAVSSLMQTSGLSLTPPSSSFWSGRRKKKIKWDNGRIVFQNSPASSVSNSSKSTGLTSDDGSSTHMSVKRKLDY